MIFHQPFTSLIAQISIEEAEERLTNHEQVVMVGGQPAIVHRRELEAQDFCEVLNLDNLEQGWSPLQLEAYSKVRFFFLLLF